MDGMLEATKLLDGIDVALGSDDRPIHDTLQLIAFAESLGVRNAWLTESRGRDVFVLLGSAAQRTTRIGLGTGITGVFSRTPTTIAQAAATLSELMPNRTVNLGLGVSGKGLVEAYHGVPFVAPHTRLRDTVRIVDYILRTGQVPDGAGGFPTQRSPMTLSPTRERVKIFVAAGGRQMLDFIGREADGWLPIWPSRRTIGPRVRAVQAAAHDAGRPPAEVAGYLYCAVGDEPGVADGVRSTMAWYIAANGTAYRSMFESYGYSREVAQIIALWQSGDRSGARSAITAEMLDDCAVVGTPFDFLRRTTSYTEIGIRPVLRIARDSTTAQVRGMLELLAEERLRAHRQDLPMGQDRHRD